MSYRNPTHYGIVEDMGAFDRSFQQTFNSAKQKIDANRAEYDKRQDIISEQKAGDINSVTEIVSAMPIKFQESLMDLYDGLISEIDYDKMDAVERAKVNQKIGLHASALKNLPDILQNYEDFDNLSPKIKTTMAQLAAGKITPYSAGGDVRVGDFTLSELAIAFSSESKLQGDENSASNLITNISNNLLSKFNNANQATSGKFQKDIKGQEDMIGKYMLNNNMVIKNDQNDYIWNNLIPEESKKITFDGTEIDLSLEGYDLRGFDDKERKIMEAARNKIIGTYIGDEVKRNLENRIKPYTPPRSSGNVPKYILDAQDLATKRSEQGTNLNNLLNSFNSNPNQLGTGIFDELTSNPTAYGIPDFYKNYTTDKDLAKTEIEQLKESEAIREDQYKKFVEQIEKAPEGTLFSFDIDDLKKKRNPILDQKQTAINLLNEAAIFENLTTQEIDGIVRKWFDSNPIQKYLDNPVQKFLNRGRAYINR